MNRFLSLTVACVGVLTGGCVADTPIADADYGKSVNQMVQSQTYDPVAASNPPEQAPASGDGARLGNALEEYRKDVAKGSADAQRPVIFEVGQQ